MTLLCGYGTYLPGAAGAGIELLEEIDLVQEAGLDAIFFSEHHGVDEYPPTPLTLAGVALGRTSTLRSGPMPTLVPLHNPVRLAEDAAVLDFVSDGRLIMGLGTGYLEQDFAQIGADLHERGARLDESLDVLKNLWSDAPEQHDGRFFTIGNNVPLTHRSPRPGGPEIWLAGYSKRMMRRAAERGAGLVLGSVMSRDEISALAADFRATCAQVGAKSGTVSVMRRAWFGDEDDVGAFLDRLADDMRRYVEMGSGRGPSAASLTKDGISARALRERVIVGTPREAAEFTQEWARQAGVDYLILKMQWGRRDFPALKEQIGRAGTFARHLSELSC